MEYGSYRGIKLVEHAMKLVERIFEHRIRQQVEIDNMQFGFMKGKGTTDAIFIRANRAIVDRIDLPYWYERAVRPAVRILSPGFCE